MLLKGLLLGVGVIALHKLCCVGIYNGMLSLIAIFAFALLQITILPSKNIAQLLCIGLFGLIVMFLGEIVYSISFGFDFLETAGSPH